MPADGADDAGGQFGRTTFLAAPGIEEAQHSAPGFIGDEREQLAVARQFELFDVPRDVRGQRGEFFRGEIEPAETLKLGIFIGGDQRRLAVFAELCVSVSDFPGGLGHEQLKHAGAQIEPVPVAFVDRDILAHEQLLPILRPIGNAPTAAGDL